ncbi:cyclic nucleotide-binding protein [Putridiphycobacter roseus]|uniref:Cyclic nucleotide-binding protein n=1 Tax=Putridiphycobacter roseus TaxID=2219161 RepID=A0A2W1NR94_9FLAO|nr:Crp/Fnr family transcriptional regulator [Putridiphycobacter roseus]PZE17208.1 cyclic nucleotide-binding protein [Putridiphycobacter roseus]
MNNELEAYISTYFGVVRPKEIKAISDLFQLTSIKKGAYFLKAGKKSERLSFVQSGLLRVFVQTADKEVTQWITTKGQFATDLSSLVFDSPARWDIQALVDTEMYSISKADYEKIGSLIPEWHLLEKLFIVRCFTMMEDRIFSHLSMSAEERYQVFFENNAALFNEVPLQYIASMLGMTPETFSRIRKKIAN